MKNTEVEKFEARDIGELVSVLEDYLGTIQRNLSLFKEEKDRWGVAEVLLAIAESFFRGSSGVRVVSSSVSPA